MTNKIASLRAQIFNMDVAELRELQELVIETMKRRMRTATRMFQQGDEVSFQTRDGRTVNGRVVKVNQKTVTVMAHNAQCTMWKVSGTLLKLKEAA